MEIKSHFNNNKNLLAVQDKNTIMVKKLFLIFII